MGLLEMAALGAAIGVDALSVGVGIGLAGFPRRRLYQFGSVFTLATASLFALGCTLAASFRWLMRLFPRGFGAGRLDPMAPDRAALLLSVVAAGILFALGLQMLKGKGAAPHSNVGALTVKGVWGLLWLAGLVSVDAISAGLSLGMLDAVEVGQAVAVVGVVNGGMAFLGLGLGRRMRAVLRERLRFLGGLILMVLAVRLLLHVF